MGGANGPGNTHDEAKVIAVDPSSGNIYVSGASYVSKDNANYTTVAYDSLGNELWARHVGPIYYAGERPCAIAVDPSTGNIYVAGKIYGIGTHYDDYITVAYDSAGNELWMARYNGPGNVYDMAHAIAVDPSTGNVYVTGYSYGSGSVGDYATVAYDSAGNELWVARYDGQGNYADKPSAMAVDPSTGNIYVTGYSYGNGSERDYATVAYDSAGNELWAVRYNGPANYIEEAWAIATDSLIGNVYVTGHSLGSGTSGDLTTVAYDSVGNELWVARYNGPGNGFDSARSITVDPLSGDIYVSGYSFGVGTGGDYATVAYDSVGNELWVARYNGPGNGFDRAQTIASDPLSGNIYVSGYSYGSGTNYDFATIKYGLSTSNTAPVADAGVDQNVTTGSLVTLNGSGSSDADGDALTYSWTFVSNPGNAVLSDPTAANPSFTPAVDGLYMLSLTVNDGTEDSLDDTVTITAITPNRAPVADAGADQDVWVGLPVTLNGSGSSDADGDALTYSWSFISNSPSAVLSDPTAVNPSFTPGAEGTYILSLVVNDGKVSSLADMVRVTVTRKCQFVGFFSPVENPPVVNKAQSGRTIPLRFQVMDQDGAYVIDPAAVTGIWYQQSLCAGTSGDELYETDTSGSSGLHYNEGANQFIYNWQTDTGMAGCYSLILEIYGSGRYQADFEFK